MDKTFERLKNASEGLLYLSESEYPFEVVRLDDLTEAPLSAASLAQQIGIAPGAKSETITLDYFFRNMVKVYPGSTQEEVQLADRFYKLAEVLKQELSNLVVYRFGQRKIEACIVGKSEEGNLYCLKTRLIET